jgi:hypothetical protein
MSVLAETLTNDNLNEVIAFIRESNPFAQRTWGWDTGRFMDWRYGFNTVKDLATPGWFAEHCAVFRDGPQIGAVSVAEYGLQSVCVITDTEGSGTIDEVLPWLIKHQADRGAGVILDISDSAEWLQPILIDHGFTREPDSGNEWEYDLAAVAEISEIAEGFTIEHLNDDRSDDYDGIAECIHRAFDSDHDSRATLTSIESSPMFRPELSVFARSPEGRIAAYCRGTADPENGVCGIDPVCCHPDFQRLGLSKAVVQACFRTQRELGGRFSYIGSAPEPAPGTYLYRSLRPIDRSVFSSWTFTAPQ